MMTWTRIIAVVAFVALLPIAQSAAARDRPGTPNEVSAYQCWGYFDLPMGPYETLPAVCVTFMNTAKERVIFDVQWSVDGIALSASDLRNNVGCMSPRSRSFPTRVRTDATPLPTQQYNCSAGMHFAGMPNASTEVGKSSQLWAHTLAMIPGVGLTLQAQLIADPEGFERQYAKTTGGDMPEQGFFVKNLEFDRQYCFRFKARDADSGVVSEIWSNTACVQTHSAPPIPPAFSATATFIEASGDKPNRVKIGVIGTAGGEDVVAYYTVGATAFDKAYDSQIKSIVEEDRRYDVGGSDPMVFKIPRNMLKDGPPILIFDVCAHNYSGETCTQAATAPLPYFQGEVPLSEEAITDNIPDKEFADPNSVIAANPLDPSAPISEAVNDDAIPLPDQVITNNIPDKSYVAPDGEVPLSDQSITSRVPDKVLLQPGSVLAADPIDPAGSISEEVNQNVMPEYSDSAALMAPASFDGSWRTIANDGAWSFDMNFTQDGPNVSGTYVVIETGVEGRIRGTAEGGVLTFNWHDVTGGGYAGNGTLYLSDDGRSFEGDYNVNMIPEGMSADVLEGTWRGERL